MKITHIGIVSPGDMGQAVAIRLREAGFEIHPALAGRGARTRALAAAAGIDDCGDVEALARRCDAILSILDPGAAMAAAGAVAGAVSRTGKRLLFADCNAVAPATKRTMDSTLREAGAVFVDAAIIGPPPAEPSPPVRAAAPRAARGRRRGTRPGPRARVPSPRPRASGSG